MSLILDALNRADNERKNQDAVPGLNTVHAAPVILVEDQPGSRRNLYIAIVIALIAMAASVFWFISKPDNKNRIVVASDGQAKPHAVSSQASLSQAAPTNADGFNADESSVGDSDNAQSPEAPETISFAEQKPAESVISAKPTAIVEQLYSAPDTPVAAADPQVNELYTAEQPTGSESIKEPFDAQPAFAANSADDSVSRRVTAEAIPARTFASITNVQDFNELPWNTKQQIPTISYQRHNFLAGGISSVVINGQTLGEGNIAPSSQLIVQEIFEDGIILKRGNVIFKLRALNGWINM